jgi:hypothetical protein
MSSENWITCARQKVGVTGLEPVTPTMSTSYSNQLSYTPETDPKFTAKFTTGRGYSRKAGFLREKQAFS